MSISSWILIVWIMKRETSRLVKVLLGHMDYGTACAICQRMGRRKSSFFCLFITVHNEVTKVIFLQASVCPQGEVPDQVHPPGSRPTREQTAPWVRYTLLEQTPPWTRYTPPRTRYTPLGPGTPPGQVHPLEQTPPQTRYTPPGPCTPPGTRYTPLGPGTHPQDQVHSPGADTPLRPFAPGTRYTPRDTATAADSTHPTGMHSCF